MRLKKLEKTKPKNPPKKQSPVDSWGKVEYGRLGILYDLLAVIRHHLSGGQIGKVCFKCEIINTLTKAHQDIQGCSLQHHNKEQRKHQAVT